jgi:LysM repeat protein
MVRKTLSRKRLLLFFLILLIPSLTFAQTQIYEEYKDYTIVRGDTLWDISQKELNDPFLWPKVWKENPDIKHPDRIYPNQKIKIPLYLLQKEIPAEKPKVVKKQKIVEEKPVEELVEPEEIKYLVDKNILIASGYIGDSVPKIGTVSDSPTDRTVLGKNDYVYIKSNKPVQVGDKFYIIDVVEKVDHPDTGRSLGYLIEILGIAEVVENSGDPKVLITASYGEISQGDLLDNFYEVEPSPAIDTPRKPNLDGYVVATKQLHGISGTFDIVYIDKGRNDGLEVGDMLATTLQSKHKIYNGLIQIINLRSSTSTAIVRKSDREIVEGDRITKAKEG